MIGVITVLYNTYPTRYALKHWMIAASRAWEAVTKKAPNSTEHAYIPTPGVEAHVIVQRVDHFTAFHYVLPLCCCSMPSVHSILMYLPYLLHVVTPCITTANESLREVGPPIWWLRSSRAPVPIAISPPHREREQSHITSAYAFSYEFQFDY